VSADGMGIKRRSDGWVYFLAGAGLIKIGWARDVRLRVREVQAMSPVELELVHQVLGSMDLETRLHRHFRGHRRHGEWFALPDGWRDQVPAVVGRYRAGLPTPEDEAYRREVNERKRQRADRRFMDAHGDALIAAAKRMGIR
jgi:hypothetical protein